MSPLVRLFVFMLAINNATSSVSFTFVVDTTESMEDEMGVIKRRIGSIFDQSNDLEGFDDFIIVPFKYPEILPPYRSSKFDDFRANINKIVAKNGLECPENILAAIKNALEVSKMGSIIFVFTDAYARDYERFEELRTLCYNTRSRVIIFLSGNCEPMGNEPVGDSEVFRKIATECSGMLFLFDLTNLKHAFRYIKEVISGDYTDVRSKDIVGPQEIKHSIDRYTTGVMVAVSSKDTKISLTDANGIPVTTEMIFTTRESQVLKLKDLKPGLITINIWNKTLGNLAIYSRRVFNFEYGFSIKIPRSFRETSKRPLPGQINYILVQVPETYNLRLIAIDVTYLEDQNYHRIDLREHGEGSRKYLGNALFQPNLRFQMTMIGTYLDDYENFNITSDIVHPQYSGNEPEAHMPCIETLDQDVLIEYGSNATIACKVVAHPSPSIHWRDDNTMYSSENILLELPETYISYLYLDKITSNTTFCCNAKNTIGEVCQNINVFVHRSNVFEVIQKPEDTVIEYGMKGKLYCQVDAYPEATIKWYHNGDSLEYSNNAMPVPEENALLIKNMGMEDVGIYACDIRNDVESQRLEAHVTISGVEKPVIELVGEAELNLKAEVETSIQCRVTQGRPKPEITWRFHPLDPDEFTDLPDDVIVSEGNLQISGVKRHHIGWYRCEANNIIGGDFKDIRVRVQSPPIIKDGTTEITVLEDHMAEIPCEVDSNPTATVQWVMNAENFKSFDSRHYTDEHNMHRFIARWNDTGEYKCIAENAVGRAEKIIKVIVHVFPYIAPPPHSIIVAKAGTSVTLNCHVEYGNPTPTLSWEFTGLDGVSKVIRRNTEQEDLILDGVTSNQEGNYTCLAESIVGHDSINIHLRVV